MTTPPPKIQMDIVIFSPPVEKGSRAAIRDMNDLIGLVIDVGASLLIPLQALHPHVSGTNYLISV